MDFSNTLDNSIWFNKYVASIKGALPETWTHMSNLDVLKLGWQFKLSGLDWRSNDDFASIMTKLEKMEVMLRDNLLVKRSS